MNWYKNKGVEGDIVLSTRIRLARNIKQFPFPARLDAEGREKVNEFVVRALDESGDEELKLNNIDMASLSAPEIVSLAEKHLISAEFASDTTGRRLLLSDDEDISIMLCEEDHIRIQVVYPGLCLEEAFQTAEKFDKALQNKLNFAFDEKLGYLTQCPTCLGTALRTSVMLHLPALSKKGAIQRLSTTVAKLGLTLRGVYMQGRENTGDIFQLCNQVTLGISEEAAIKNLSSIATQIIAQEKAAREEIVKDDDYIDCIYRAQGILKSAYKLSMKEFMALASIVRVGVTEGIIEADTDKLKELLITLQGATLNASEGKILTQKERDILRAEKVRESLSA